MLVKYMKMAMDWLNLMEYYLYKPYAIMIIAFASLSFLILLICIFWKYYPVNCWFCNSNSRVNFKLKNSWTCPHCQQYNGFTRDGDYNKPMYQNMQHNNMYNYNRFPPRSAKNGFCHKCNTNQQLKIMQLANFKPLNKNNFDQEVDQFKLHLDDVYKLCKKCKKIVNKKLLGEKGAFLNPKNNLTKSTNKLKMSYYEKFKKILNITSLTFSYFFIIIIILDIYVNANLFFSKKFMFVMKQHINNMVNYANLFCDKLLIPIQNSKDSFTNSTVFNSAVNLFNQHTDLQFVRKYIDDEKLRNNAVKFTLQTLASTQLALQIISFIIEVGKSFKSILNILIWCLCSYLIWNGDKYLLIVQFVLSCLTIWFTKKSMIQNREKGSCSPYNNGKVWKNMKNLSNDSPSLQYSDDEDVTSDESDFDDPNVGNNRTSTPENIYSNKNYNFADHVCQVTRPYGFQIGNHSNPSYDGYNLSNFKSSHNYNVHNNFTTELDRGIGTLNLEDKELRSNNGSKRIFSPNCYGTVSPSTIISNNSFTLRKPILSPSRFIYSTQQSWVAGGYWGSESPTKTHPSQNSSRSSSQSSGFESMTSGNHKNGYFLPPNTNDINTSKKTFSTKSDEMCDKSLYSNSSLRCDNVFRNIHPSSNTTFPQCRTLFDSSRNRGSTFGPDNLREYSFVTPNPRNSFIPLDKPIS